MRLPKTLRLELRRIRISARPVAEIDALLRADQDARRWRPDPAAPQLTLALVMVECEETHGMIPVFECVRRAEARTPSGRGKGYPEHEFCQRCSRRELHKALLGPKVEVPRYQAFNIRRQNQQKGAQSRLIRSGALDPVRSMDDPAGEEV